MRKFNFKRMVCIFLLTGGMFSATAQNYDMVKLVAGAKTDGDKGLIDATGTAARFNQPSGIAINTNGDIYIADLQNHVIRKMTVAGVVTTFAGTGVAGYLDSPNPLLAQFDTPWDVAVDKNGDVLVVDYNNSRFRRIKVNPNGTAGEVTTFAGTGTLDDATSRRQRTPTVGTDPTTVNFHQPSAVTVDKDGVIYLGEGWTGRVRKIDTDGLLYYVTGTGPEGNEYQSVDGLIATARISRVDKLATDNDGDLYISERTQNNNLKVAKIRKITFSTGQISTLAGGNAEGNTDVTNALDVRFNQPWGLVVDASKNVYFTDFWNHKIRKITPAGVATILAGSTSGATITDEAVAISDAKFFYPKGLAKDAAGNLYVAEGPNAGGGRIRMIYDSSTLPVNIVSFNAVQQNNGIKLDWSTASESNNSHFEILRSSNANDFVSLGTVNGNNNSNSVLNYTFTDDKPLEGINYYKFKQEDFDGKISFSNVISVKFGLEDKNTLTAYYNSKDSKLVLNMGSKTGKNSVAKVLTIDGKVVFSASVENSVVELPLSLQKGIYVVTLNGGNNSSFLKFIAE